MLIGGFAREPDRLLPSIDKGLTGTPETFSSTYFWTFPPGRESREGDNFSVPT